MSPAKTFATAVGPAFFSLIASTMLYGVTCVQMFMFFHEYARQNNDSRTLKSFVAVLWFLDTVHVALSIHSIYFYAFINFGKMSALAAPTWSVLAQSYITAVMIFMVRSFFARRVAVLSGRKKFMGIVVPIIILAIAAFIAVLLFVYITISFHLATFMKIRRNAWMLVTVYGSSTLVDTIIATSLVTLLISQRTGLRKTDNIVKFLLKFTVNTGLITCLWLIGCLVAEIVWPDRLVVFGLSFVLSKLYVNTLLASLNARESLRSHNHDPVVSSMRMATGPIQLSMTSKTAKESTFESF